MESAVITVFLTGLLVFCVEGQLAPKLKCSCVDNGVNSINPKLIKEYEWHDPSSFCPRMEIIVTTREGKKCVNPESKFGRFLIERSKNKNERKHMSTSGITTSGITTPGITTTGITTRATKTVN